MVGGEAVDPDPLLTTWWSALMSDAGGSLGQALHSRALAVFGRELTENLAQSLFELASSLQVVHDAEVQR
jgi:hypothetical protein